MSKEKYILGVGEERGEFIPIYRLEEIDERLETRVTKVNFNSQINAKCDVTKASEITLENEQLRIQILEKESNLLSVKNATNERINEVLVSNRRRCCAYDDAGRPGICLPPGEWPLSLMSSNSQPLKKYDKIECSEGVKWYGYDTERNGHNASSVTKDLSKIKFLGIYHEVELPFNTNVNGDTKKLSANFYSCPDGYKVGCSHNGKSVGHPASINCFQGDSLFCYPG